MKCPNCNSDDLKVIDTRTKKFFIRRKRQCLSCKCTFYTVETIDLSEIRVQKKNGSIQSFNRLKILKGLERCFNKINITEEELNSVLENIEMEIYRKKINVISAEEIGEIVLEHLNKVNGIAYLRFMSVYKRYTNVEEFLAEISKYLKEKSK